MNCEEFVISEYKKLKKEEINFLKCIDTNWKYLEIDYGRETMNFYCDRDKY